MLERLKKEYPMAEIETIDAKINPDYKILNNGDKTINLLAQEFAAAYVIG